MTNRSWVQPPTKKTIFHGPSIWIKACCKSFQTTRHCCIRCNPGKGRVEFEDKIQLHNIKLFRWKGLKSNNNKKPIPKGHFKKLAAVLFLRVPKCYLEKLGALLFQRVFQAVETFSARPTNGKGDNLSDRNVTATTQQNLAAPFVTKNAESKNRNLISLNFENSGKY